MLRRSIRSFTAAAATQGSISKVLVANRGEIACRVFRTAKAMGLQTVAVYCDAEKNGKHVQHADEAFRIGPPPASSSYLVGENILAVAKKSGANAIHPGYGFLSENANFAEMVRAAGVEWIGPPPSAIIAMGSKSESKIIMTKAGIPVVPGYHGEDQSNAKLSAEAVRIGFPLLIKAVSGGGGKGMKIVRSADEFQGLLDSARREATNFFKDDRVLLEKYIERPRHIECQVFCDKHGNGVYFFERDCSVQRRYQKVLEEAPAPHLTQELRTRFGTVAVAAAQAVGYVGAGTVEFIFDTDTNEFYFMEMNTRLQVEHPVTEEVVLVKGRPLDLVRLQIETANGKPFDFTQADLQLNGHCIEARVFAESPRDNFLPGSGHLACVQEPVEGPVGDVKVRLDTGFRSGDDVLVHYDPMIAKLIVWGPSRERALRGLRKALDDYHIVGIKTNIEFLKECCDHAQFAAGGVSTKFIEENREVLLRPRPVSSIMRALAAVTYAAAERVADAPFPLRINGECRTVVPFVDEATKQPQPVTVTVTRNGTYTVTFEGVSHHIASCPALVEGNTAVHVDGQRVEYRAVNVKGTVAILHSSGTHQFRLLPLPSDFGQRTSVSLGTSVLSPMPGKVSKFLQAPGAAVKQGQPVLIVEAMKMEHIVKAPCDGVIKYLVREGDMSSAEQLLATLVVDTVAA